MLQTKELSLTTSKPEETELLWKHLVEENLDFAYQVARRFLTADADIQDAIQAAFVKAWKSFQQYDAKQSVFSTWLYSILRNTCIDMQRQLARQNSKHADIHSDRMADSRQEVVDKQIENREIYQLILAQADQLPLKQKECFILKDIQGYSIKEIAELTHQSNGSVKTSIYLARKKLRQWIIERKIL